MNREKEPIEALLNYGSDRAIKLSQLMNFFNASEREIRKEVARERKKGIPILSKKTEGGGYYFSDNEEDITAYLTRLEKEIQAQQETLNAVRDYFNRQLQTTFIIE